MLINFPPIDNSQMFPIQKQNVNISNYSHFQISESHNSTQKKSNLYFYQEAEIFFIQIAGAIPRNSLIRDFLLLLFPQGHPLISIQQIKRYTVNELLLFIGKNVALIQNFLVAEIQFHWLNRCIQKLKNIKRTQRTDLVILHFALYYCQILSVNKCKCSHCSNFGENCKNYFNKQF
jgi:hypothetical protein